MLRLSTRVAFRNREVVRFRLRNGPDFRLRNGPGNRMRSSQPSGQLIWLIASKNGLQSGLRSGLH